MRQIPRLRQQGNHGAQGQRIGPGPVPADTVQPPKTPHHLTRGAALDQRFQLLEDELRLGLRVRGTDWSPKTTEETKDIKDKIYGLFKRLYWKGSLDLALDEYRKRVRLSSKKSQLELLHLLHEVLKSNVPVGVRTPSGTKNKSELAPSLFSDQPTRLGNLFKDNAKTDEEADSHYTVAGADDPGSPTDVDDDDDYYTPPSPSKSASQRREGRNQFMSPSPHTRKRPSEGSSASENSPKNTRTNKGKQPVDNASVPHEFKKPLPKMSRSFTSSASNSFNGADTVFSSQQTQATSAATSFNTDGAGDCPPYNGPTARSSTSYGSLSITNDVEAAIKRTESLRGRSDNWSAGRSSTSFGSLSETGAMNTLSRIEREHLFGVPKEQNRIISQEANRESNSTYGSVDEEMLCTKTIEVEKKSSSRSALTPRSGQESTRSDVVVRHLQTPPSEPRVGPQEAQSASSKKPREHYMIREIPKENLFVKDLCGTFHHVPYFVLFICQYLSVTYSVTLERLLQTVRDENMHSSPDAFWPAVQTQLGTKVCSSSKSMGKQIWQAAKKDFEGYTFKGQISFNTRQKGPVFSFQPSPIQADKSCRFQRKFGADRFLYLTAPIFESKLTRNRFTKADMKQIIDRWNQWLGEEHSFLNRKWKVFHVEPIKHKKGKRGQNDPTHDKRIVLFATEGCGIEKPCSIGEMINWFLPFAQNQDQTFCKAYARLDLGLSRTIPTLAFKPSQIKYVEDIHANGEEEAAEFNDRKLRWEAIPEKQVMNDGCSLISVAAAIEIWKRYREAVGLKGPQALPSAFQGRIGGAKGMWIVSGESFSRNPNDLDFWIQISKSQLKFEPHAADLLDHTKERLDEPFDPLRLTFEVTNYSTTPSPSELHISFIQILVDRGVPRETIAALMKKRLDADRAELLDALKDTTRMYEWLYRNGAKSLAGHSANIMWQGAVPVGLEEKLKLLLECGFHPAKLPYLASSIERFVQNKQVLKESKLRTPLGKSTFLFGIADPLGVLRPGEVHVQFSSRFIDELTEESYLNLKNMNILVARQPACRRSDIQKVRTIVHPDLSHLVDIVVFPSRGQFPLAGKLQGGDYDGDLFWLCWEDTLVDPFLNAPAPVQSPDPVSYGIRVNKRRVREVMDPNNPNTVSSLLREAFEFRSDPSLLGQATVLLEKVAYRENRIYSMKLDHLCGLHDLLVDAPKQGYIFTKDDFQKYQNILLGARARLKQPAYKEAMEKCLSTTDINKVDDMRKDDQHNPNNVVDWLYFEVCRRHNAKTSEQLKQTFANEDTEDDTLTYPYKNLKEKESPTINYELQELLKQLTTLLSDWNKGFKKLTTGTTEEKDVYAEKCYQAYKSIQPCQPDSHDIKPMLERYCSPDTDAWDTIKASTLYSIYPQANRANFVFKMAGLDLARLKARSFPQTRDVIASIYANMKPKRIKTPAELDEADDESEDEFQTALDEAVA